MGSFFSSSIVFIFFLLGGLASPSLAAANPLLGTWNYAFLTYINETIVFSDSTHMKDKNVMGGQTFLDIEGTYVFDPAVVPNRLLITVTKSDPASVVKTKPGDHFYCIYRANATMLNLNCNSPEKAEYPTEFNEALGFTKVHDFRHDFLSESL